MGKTASIFDKFGKTIDLPAIEIGAMGVYDGDLVLRSYFKTCRDSALYQTYALLVQGAPFVFVGIVVDGAVAVDNNLPVGWGINSRIFRTADKTRQVLLTKVDLTLYKNPIAFWVASETARLRVCNGFTKSPLSGDRLSNSYTNLVHLSSSMTMSLNKPCCHDGVFIHIHSPLGVIKTLSRIFAMMAFSKSKQFMAFHKRELMQLSSGILSLYEITDRNPESRWRNLSLMAEAMSLPFRGESLAEILSNNAQS